MNIDYEKNGKENPGVSSEAKYDAGTIIRKLQILGCDISRSALAKIEVAQRHIYPDEIKLIKSILNITYDELFF